MKGPDTGLRIDLGCGSVKKEGTIGVDILPSPEVDHVLDIEKQPLPFGDESVAYVHSSHFLEHIRDPTRIFGEIGRVCADGARVELWTPYAWSNSAFIIDHKCFYTEDIYIHMCVWFVDFWRNLLGGRWVLEEFQYVVDPGVLCYLKDKGVTLDFALRHLRNVVTEFGTFITVRKNDEELPPPATPRRTFSTARLAPRYEVQPDRAGPAFGANGAGNFAGSDDEAVEEAIRTFARGGTLPAM